MATFTGKERGFNHFPLVRVWTIPNPGDTPTRLQTVQQDLAAGSYRCRYRRTNPST